MNIPGQRVFLLERFLQTAWAFLLKFPLTVYRELHLFSFMIVDHQRIAFKHYGNADCSLDTYYHNSYSYKNGYIFRINKNILLIEKADLIKE